jgi:hypothetical protein
MLRSRLTQAALDYYASLGYRPMLAKAAYQCGSKRKIVIVTTYLVR